MHEVKLHIANSAGTLDKLVPVIKREFKAAISIAERTIAAQDVDVVVNDRPYWTIPELGIGGRMLSDRLVLIDIDTSKQIESVEWKATILHEIHHAMRYKAIFSDVAEEHTLLDSLIDDGLATYFEEQTIGRTAIYARVPIKANNITQAKKLFSSKKYDHNDWFFGNGKDIPRWFGYSLGYRIVDMASKDLGKSAAEMVGYKTEIFRPYAEKI